MISQNDFWNGKKFGIFTQPPEFFQMLREYLLESTLPKVVAHEMMMNSTSSYMVILCVSLRSLISIASLKKKTSKSSSFQYLEWRCTTYDIHKLLSFKGMIIHTSLLDILAHQRKPVFQQHFWHWKFGEFYLQKNSVFEVFRVGWVFFTQVNFYSP